MKLLIVKMASVTKLCSGHGRSGHSGSPDHGGKVQPAKHWKQLSPKLERTLSPCWAKRLRSQAGSRAHSIAVTAHHFVEKCVSTSQAKQRSHVEECLLYEDKRECRSDLAVNGVACRRAAALSPMKLPHLLIYKYYFVKLLGMDQSTKFSYLTIWCCMVCRIPS